MSRAKALLGFEPLVSVEQGLQRTWHSISSTVALLGKDGWKEEPCSLWELKHQIHILYRLSCCPPSKIVNGCNGNGRARTRIDFYCHIAVVRTQSCLGLW